MALEDNKPEMVVIHLYEGKVIDVWVAYQADNPHNYVLGRSQQEAQEAFLAQPEIEFLIDGVTGGFRAVCHKFKDLVGVGASKREAERRLMRQINLLSNRVDWREMFFELVAATGDAWLDQPWADRERSAVSNELSRRRVAAEMTPKPQESGPSHAETPFCD